MAKWLSFWISVLAGLVLTMNRSQASGDVARGAKAFGMCAACHSLAPDLNRTGPSLAGIWDRKAGSLHSLERYSPALRQSGVTWNTASLDAWLRGPAAFVAGNYMTFPGLPEQGQREDVIAFLKAVSMSERGGPPVTIPSEYTAPLLDLKRVRPALIVMAIRAWGDSYFVTTEDNNTHPFWDENLRFKTDASAFGPKPGVPVIMTTGMFGDRASVIFNDAKEIGTFIDAECK